MGNFLEILAYLVAGVWGLPCLISLAYAGWLVYVSRDVVYEGTIFWRGLFPALRFRLISRKSWYARAWARWYGQAVFMVIIHKDRQGVQDDGIVEQVIIHEMRHIAQQWALGLFQWVFYGINYAYLAVCTNKNPYKFNWFERDARRYTANWVLAGRPKRFNLGLRN